MTLKMKPTKAVHMSASTTNSKKQVMLVIILIHWKMLPAMLIFKGASNGHIANHEFGTYPDRDHSSELTFLVPWRDTKLPAIDTCCMHMMGMVVNCIQSLGIEVIRIPMGCTICLNLLMQESTILSNVECEKNGRIGSERERELSIAPQGVMQKLVA